jgi:hypothetical protein
MKRILVFLVASLLGLFSLTAQITVDLTWANGIGAENVGSDLFGASTIDAAGNFYLTGRISDTTDFDGSANSYTLEGMNQGFIAKYNPSGVLQWAKTFAGVGVSEGKAIGVDASGNVFISGYFQSGMINFDPSASNYTLTPQSNDMFIAKFNSAGSFQWAYGIGAISSNINTQSLKVDATGNLIICGDFYTLGSMEFNPAGPSYTLQSNTSTPDAFVAKYNTSGILQWAFNYGDVNSDYAYGMDVDAAGNIYVTGEFQLTANFNPLATTTTLTASGGAKDIYFAKYTPAGILTWVKSIGGAQDDGCYRIKVDNAGDVLLSGYMASLSMDVDPSTLTVTINKAGAGPTDLFVGKYSGATGNLIWAKNSGGSNNLFGYSISSDQQNNVYVSGSFDEVADFDLSIGSYTLAPYTSMISDLFLAKYNPQGDLIYANSLGLAGSSASAYQINVDNSNNIYLSGSYYNSIDVDFSVATNTIAAFGADDIFFAKYSQCISPQTPTLSATSVSMCANGVTTLSIASGNLNSATTWVWSAMSCGSSTIGTGPTVTVSPVFLTSYFVRGEGGCPTPTGSCASASVMVIASKDITGSVTTSLSAPVTGSVMIYRYEGALTMWDYVGFQNIDASGNYTFNAVNSNSYIIKCVPVSNTLQVTYSPNAISWKGATVFAHSCLNTATMNISVNPIIDIGTGPGVLSGKLTEGIGYASRGANVFAPGNPIKGMIIKGGRNPGGDIVNQVVTDAAGGFTITGLPENTAGQNYFLYVDIPGLDTNGTYRRAIITGSTSYANLDFVADSSYIHPILNFVGVQEVSMDDKIISVYPNPASSKITVAIDKGNVNALSVAIVDVFGKVIRTHTFESNEEKVSETMDVSDLSKGIYFIRIGIDNNIRQVKLIISE